MNDDQRAIRRKLRILNYAAEIGSVVKTCRHFNIGRASFYRWRAAYQKNGETGLIDKRYYRKRNRIEIMFKRLKGWRRVAPRYDRYSKVFPFAIALAASLIFWL